MREGEGESILLCLSTNHSDICLKQIKFFYIYLLCDVFRYCKIYFKIYYLTPSSVCPADPLGQLLVSNIFRHQLVFVLTSDWGKKEQPVLLGSHSNYNICCCTIYIHNVLPAQVEAWKKVRLSTFGKYLEGCIWYWDTVIFDQQTSHNIRKCFNILWIKFTQCSLSGFPCGKLFASLKKVK